MNLFKDVFGISSEEAMEMGVMCFKLGLTREDIQPMARAYAALHGLNVGTAELGFVLNQIRKAYDAANEVS